MSPGKEVQIMRLSSLTQAEGAGPTLVRPGFVPVVPQPLPIEKTAIRKLRILVADDHTLIRQGLRRILQEKSGWEVIAEAHDGQEAVLRTLELRPDIVIMDIAMPLLNGMEATRQICQKAPDVRILILSMHMEESYVLPSLQAGARGYLLKDSADIDLLRAVAVVSEGKSFFSPAVAKMVRDTYVRQLEQHGVRDRFELLSEREREVLQLIAEGHSNRKVANLLSLRTSTVETHRARIMEKLDLHNTAEIILYAVRKGLRLSSEVPL
jgi:DNA-binding NarL/FixJ family response regulator